MNKTINLHFGAFVEVADTKDVEGTRIREVFLARARALDAQCQGRTESDALRGLAEYYGSVANNLHNHARLAERTWQVRYAEMPIATNPTKTATVVAASEDEAIESIQKGIAAPIRVQGVTFVPPPPPEPEPVPSTPSFDDCHDVGLDGTLRDGSEPHTWEDVARAALAKLRATKTAIEAPARPRRTIDADQLEALQQFAERHGRNWKQQLSYCWETGDYGITAHTAELQQIRNTFGPSWLVRFSFTKTSTHRELP
jgi:hypothetical protein